MSQLIRIKMYDKQFRFAPVENFLNLSSIKAASMIANEAIVSMSYQLAGEEVHCEMTKDGLAFILPKGYAHLQFTVETNEAPSKRIPDDFDASVSRKRQKLDPEMYTLPLNGDTVFEMSKYVWYYTKGDNIKILAIPVLTTMAITFSHGTNKDLVKGDIIKLTSHRTKKVVETCVVLVDHKLDIIALQSESDDLCDTDVITEACDPKEFEKYISMSYSNRYDNTSHILFSAGTISLGKSSGEFLLRRSASFNGDSGGSCWSDDGSFMGMQVCFECGLQSRLIPASSIHSVLTDFLPTEEDLYRDLGEYLRDLEELEKDTEENTEKNTDSNELRN